MSDLQVEFNKSGSYCKICQRKYYRKYASSKPEYIDKKNKSNSEAKIQKRQIIDDYKANQLCHDCGLPGSTNIRMFDFDHVRGQKLFSIARGIQMGYSLDKLFQEIQKCDFVCANCHRVRTFNRKMV